MVLSCSFTNATVPHACKITQKPDCKPVLPAAPITAGSPLHCVTRERIKDRDRYDYDIAKEVKKPCQAILLTTASESHREKQKYPNNYGVYIQGTMAPE